MSLTLLSWTNPIDWKDVINDFGKKINYTRFSKRVLLIKDNFQDNIFDTTTLASKDQKKVPGQRLIQ
jgi:hypothetical protein